MRPISLTSNLVKLTERVLNARVIKYIEEKSILNPSQIGFKSGCSIWCAHADLESRIQLARRRREYCALVTLDLAKAYDKVEHKILIEQMEMSHLPNYMTAWVAEFLREREFYCFQRGCFSNRYRQYRGVPQGAVLSPVLFNIFLSSIPTHSDIHLYVYADDIIFFATNSDLQLLYQTLQNYLNMIEEWLEKKLECL